MNRLKLIGLLLFFGMQLFSQKDISISPYVNHSWLYNYGELSQNNSLTSGYSKDGTSNVIGILLSRNDIGILIGLKQLQFNGGKDISYLKDYYYDNYLPLFPDYNYAASGISTFQYDFIGFQIGIFKQIDIWKFKLNLMASYSALYKDRGSSGNLELFDFEKGNDDYFIYENSSYDNANQFSFEPEIIYSFFKNFNVHIGPTISMGSITRIFENGRTDMQRQTIEKEKMSFLNLGFKLALSYRFVIK